MKDRPAEQPIGFSEIFVNPSEERVGRWRAPIVVIGGTTPSNTTKPDKRFSAVEYALAEAAAFSGNRKPFITYNLRLNKEESATSAQNQNQLNRLYALRVLVNGGGHRNDLVVPDFNSLGTELTDAICRVAVGTTIENIPAMIIRKFDSRRGFVVHSPRRELQDMDTGLTVESIAGEAEIIMKAPLARGFEEASAKAMQLINLGWSRADVCRYLAVYGFTNRSGNVGAWHGKQLDKALAHGALL